MISRKRTTIKHRIRTTLYDIQFCKIHGKNTPQCTTRYERAATIIQAMVRGVVGREGASDERKRQDKINDLLLNALKRLGGPVFREWQAVVHELRRVRRKTVGGAVLRRKI